jgi:hypothetical protein
MEDLLTTDRTLSQAYHTKYVNVLNKHMEYGTSGFRAKAEFLDFVLFLFRLPSDQPYTSTN